MLLLDDKGVFCLNVKYNNRCHPGVIPKPDISAANRMLIEVYKYIKSVCGSKKVFIPLNRENNRDFFGPEGFRIWFSFVPIINNVNLYGLGHDLLGCFPRTIKSDMIPVSYEPEDEFMFDHVWGLTALDRRMMPRIFEQKGKESKRVKKLCYDCQYEIVAKKRKLFDTDEVFCPTVCPYTESVLYQNWLIYMREETNLDLCHLSANMYQECPFRGTYGEDGIQETADASSSEE